MPRDGIKRKEYICMKRNLIEDIYEDLRSRILTEKMLPGQKISEITLAEQYECSRTPVREALKRLENDDLIVIKPKSGTYIQNETPRDFVELMQVRASLERLAFQLSLKNAADKEIRKLESIMDSMNGIITNEPIDMMKFATAHYDFHYQLVTMSGNDLLIRQFEKLNLRRSHMFYTMMDKRLAGDTQDEHRKIIQLLKSKDLQGADYVENHLDRKIGRYLNINEA
jgi:DNA-binding GntR family transcriptional regulator